MADIEALRAQTYSTNLELLLQQRGSKFRTYCRTESAAGAKAHRFLSQLDKVTGQRRVGPAEVIDNQATTFTGRWVLAPLPFHFDTIVDDIDLLQTNIMPQGELVMSAVASLNRQIDDDFTTAFFGDAKTGETGGTTTSFTSGNQIAVTEGVGSATGLNIAKLRAARKKLLENEVDLDNEKPVIAMSPKQQDELLASTEIGSADFNSVKALVDGRVTSFMGFDFIISNRLPTDSNSYRRLPVWVKSGMGCATWFDIKSDIRRLPNYKGNPILVEAESMLAFTRLEENKCVEIKCAEA